MSDEEQTDFFIASMMPGGGMEVRIEADHIENAQIAGIMLADFTNHLAEMLVQTGKSSDRDTALQDMLQLFAAEMNNPTDDPTGSLQS